MEKINNRLVAISELEDDWDGYGGYPISEKTINLVKEFLSKLPEDILSKLHHKNITPTPYATVILEWEKEGGFFVSLEIGENGCGYYSHIENGEKDCGCGEGLCNVVGTPIGCKFTKRLSPYNDNLDISNNEVINVLNKLYHDR